MKGMMMAIGLLAPLVAAAWSWEMPGDVYRELDVTSRAGVDRAAKIFSQAVEAERRGTRVTEVVPRFRAAVAEWRKVQVQAEAENFDETMISYSVFMQAYARERAHDLNEALKLYDELIELHPDVGWIVIPAKYRVASCRYALGEKKKGDKAIDDFVADKQNEGHELMARALDSQAWRLWREGSYEEAVENWRLVLHRRYAATCGDLQRQIRELFITLSLVTGDFDRFDEIMFGDVREGDDKGRCERCRWAVERAYGCVVNGASGYRDRSAERYPDEKERKKKLEEARKWFVRWFEDKRAIYEKAGRGIDYLYTSVTVALAFGDKDQANKCFARILDYLRGEKNEKTRNARAKEAINLALGAGRADYARSVADLIKGKFVQCWTRYEIENRIGDYKKAAAYVEDYIALKPEAGALRNAKWTLANLCRDRLGQMERAVKLYQEIDDPPATLWALIDCYRRMGKRKEAYQLLDEIASIFENEAPKAILTAAGYRVQDGEREKGIALYKRLLTHPEWKQRGESSAAHQALERLGVATGGAMTNEVR